MKQAFSKYADVRSIVKTIDRKEQGTLLVRPLDPYVTQDDVVETDMFTTIMIVVPSLREQEFLQQYETFEEAFALRRAAKESKTQKNDEKEEAKSEEAAAKSKVEPCFNVVPNSAR